MKKKLLVPLLTKGATNHLYRTEITDELEKSQVKPIFLVREDYWHILKLLPGFEHHCYKSQKLKGWKKNVVEFCNYVRFLYPSDDPWKKWRFEVRLKQMSMLGRITEYVFNILARSKLLLSLLIQIEGLVYNSLTSEDLDCLAPDGVLMIGVGVKVDAITSRITWWARKKRIPCIHWVGNYDGLSSKGFRGYPIDKILVWGEQMTSDALELQGISPEAVNAIGAVRYSMIPAPSTRDRKKFFEAIELDSELQTIAFAGSAYAFHYFEMLSAFQEFKKQSGKKVQLIIRVYPSNKLLNSPFIDTLMGYVKGLSDVWVSVGDPNYKKMNMDRESLQIDENDLWSILEFSDVVVNIFSTLTIEACIFNKPIINMWYFDQQARCFQQPIFFPYPIAKHIRRVLRSKAAPMVNTREELLKRINTYLGNPRLDQDNRNKLKEMECGMIEGAVERLVHSCCDIVK